MTELFTLIFDMGRDAPVESIAAVFASLDEMVQIASELAVEIIEVAVEEGVRLGSGDNGSRDSFNTPAIADLLATGNPTKGEVAALYWVVRKALERAPRQGLPPPVHQYIIESLTETGGKARAAKLLVDRFDAQRAQALQLRSRREQEARQRTEMAALRKDTQRIDDALSQVAEQIGELSNRQPPTVDEIRDDPMRYLAEWGRSQQEQLDQLDEARKQIERDLAIGHSRLRELASAITPQPSPWNAKVDDGRRHMLDDEDFTFSYLWLMLFSAELSVLPGGENFAREWAAASLKPQDKYRFRSIRYENPLTVEIISEVGFAAASLALVLRLIRDWRSDRRRSAALAADAESRTAFRSELRGILIDQVRQKKLELSAHALDVLMSGDAEDALHSLASSPPTVEWREISEDR
jgi:hypothetical protein